MNNLFATWHHAPEIELGAGPGFDVGELPARAHAGLAGIPELADARRLVAVALGEVSAWAAAELDAVRSSSYA